MLVRLLLAPEPPPPSPNKLIGRRCRRPLARSFKVSSLLLVPTREPVCSEPIAHTVRRWLLEEVFGWPRGLRGPQRPPGMPALLFPQESTFPRAAF